MEEKPWTVEEPAREDGARRRLRVLLVDDEADMLSVLRSWLSPMYEVETLSAGRQLVDTALRFRPDLVILDLSLPDADGYDLCRALRGVKAVASVPVLFLTGRESEVEFLDRRDTGGDGFLQKPVEREQLLSHVRILLR
ncbi:MAG: response regulator [Elusimicrobia bacterium]|nr:response regulator [Elusimicrobiota bacterium]